MPPGERLLIFCRPRRETHFSDNIMLTKQPVSVNKFFALLWVKKEKKRAHIAFSSDFGYDVSDLEKQREGNAMNRRKILCIILIIAVLAGTAAAFFLSGSSSAPEITDGEDLAAQLAGLDGVVSVESVEQNAEDADGNPQYCYRYKYFVTFPAIPGTPPGSRTPTTPTSASSSAAGRPIPRSSPTSGRRKTTTIPLKRTSRRRS